MCLMTRRAPASTASARAKTIETVDKSTVEFMRAHFFRCPLFRGSAGLIKNPCSDVQNNGPRSFVSFEESSSLGSGGIFERGSGGSESGLVATSLLRVNARPRKPIAIKIAPPIISQCGNSIDESRPIYFPFTFSPISTNEHYDRVLR
jgi:hypothetical protein